MHVRVCNVQYMYVCTYLVLKDVVRTYVRMYVRNLYILFMPNS